MLLLSLLKQNSAFSLCCSCWVFCSCQICGSLSGPREIVLPVLPFPPFQHPLGNLQPKALLGLGICLAQEMPLGTRGWKGQGTFPSPGNSHPGVNMLCLSLSVFLLVTWVLWERSEAQESKGNVPPFSLAGSPCPLGCSRPVILYLYSDIPCVQMCLPLGLGLGGCL